MMTAQWGEWLIRGWNDCGWMAQPGRVGDRIAGLIGAEPGPVTTGDTLSINIYQTLAAALAMPRHRLALPPGTRHLPHPLQPVQRPAGTKGVTAVRTECE